MKPSIFRRGSGVAFACLVFGLSALSTGCAIHPPATQLADVAPSHWSAPLPHGGARAGLADWWAGFDDPSLSMLIDTAQNWSPTIERATHRIAEARANARIAGAAAWPALDLNAAATRGNSMLISTGTPSPSTLGSATLDAAWELDWFGAARNQASAARARARASEAQWHDARVSLAAEVANAYVGLRACEALLDIEEAQARSLAQTADLTRRKLDAGFEAPANAALARASWAEASARAIAQGAECDVSIKILSTLSTVSENRLREALLPGRARLPTPRAFDVPAIPASVLSQRPDLAAAEAAVRAAAAEVGVAQADRYPRIALTGTIGRSSLRVGGQALNVSTWSFGPSLLLPLFDAGRRGAAVDASRARLDAALADWQGLARTAVGEVEQALVRLDAANRRLDDTRRAVQGYEEFLRSAHSQWEAGVGSLLDLEQARRTTQAARATLVLTERDRVASWLALYKAVGGGWSSTTPVSSSHRAR